MTEEDQEAVEHLLTHRERVLTAWEVDFLENIQERGVLTPKQKENLDRIWDEVVVEGRREE